jgi:CRISPR/Cas system-associated endonuclease Cas1
MRLCVEKGISISFMNEYGKFLARVTGPSKEMFSYAAHNLSYRMRKRSVLVLLKI